MDLCRTQEIVDVIHGAIAYSGMEEAVIGTPIFNRLHRILQSSMVYLTFPSNEVKRFEHSLGVMYIAGEFFFRSICNSDPDILRKFFDEVNQALIEWNCSLNPADISYVHAQCKTKYGKEKILNLPWPSCRLYFQKTPANIPDKKYFLGYYVVYQSIRLAGLLHDVGHLPYSHVLEASLQALCQEVQKIPEEEQNQAHQHFLHQMEKYCNPEAEFAIHEELGQLFVGKIFESITQSLPKGEDSLHYFLAAVLHFTRRILAAKDGDNTLFSDLHRIVAGTLDSDRMDYCSRDAYCAGTSKDLPNYARILSTVKIVYHPTPPGLYEGTPAESRVPCYFMPSTKAISEIEKFLQRRWDIFATINYHHRVHKHEILLVKVLTKLGLREMSSGIKPAELTDVLPLEISSIWQLISQMNFAAPVDYFAIQLDDSWLDTLLKKKFFQEYWDSYLSFKDHGDDVMWHRLDELISAQKHYFTLFKRPGGFRQFDVCFYAAWESSVAEPETDMTEQTLNEQYSKLLASEGEYFFNRKLREFFRTKDKRKAFFDLLNHDVFEEVCPQERYGVADCFLADNSFSLGISMSDQLYIYSSKQKVKPFVHYSPLYNQLFSAKKLFPSLHIYYLPAYDVKHSEYKNVDQDAFMKCIATKAVSAMYALSQEKEPVPTA